MNTACSNTNSPEHDKFAWPGMPGAGISLPAMRLAAKYFEQRDAVRVYKALHLIGTGVSLTLSQAMFSNPYAAVAAVAIVGLSARDARSTIKRENRLTKQLRALGFRN